jgi:predicted porin
VHGSQRFIGGVAWRQNEQTYDGFRADWKGGPGLSADLSYVYNVNRIFGPDAGPVQPKQLEGDNYFARLGWQIAESHSLTAFSYILDIDEEEDYPAGRSVDNSSDTYGLEYAGAIGPVDVKAAYATQSDGGDSNLSYDAGYYMAEVAATFFGIKGTAGYEVLEGDDGVGFKTPYATLHKFQGWADKFLVTPGDGIEDAYVGLAGALGPVKLAAIYHDFQANDSSADFGTELDLVATYPVTKNLTVQLKYAAFESDDEDRYTDTDKAWVTVQLKI